MNSLGPEIQHAYTYEAESIFLSQYHDGLVYEIKRKLNVNLINTEQLIDLNLNDIVVNYLDRI